jgi:hypothetical protein
VKWLDALFEKMIRRRAETAVMREFGVSRPYVREVIANLDQLRSGAITERQWLQRAVVIADRYPEDAGTADLVGDLAGNDFEWKENGW